MNYKRVYEEFIKDRRAKELGLVGYTERHHIVPRSMGGSNAKENLIRLTPEDHFFAHRVLARIYGGPCWSAFVLMLCTKRPRRRVRVEYGFARRTHATYMSTAMAGVPKSEEHRAAMSLVRRGKSRSPEICANISAGKKGRPRKGVAHSAATRSKISEALKGKSQSIASRNKKSESNKGKVRSADARAKIAAAKMGLLNPSADQAIYRWVVCATGEHLEATRSFIHERFGVSSSHISDLLHGRAKTSMGIALDGTKTQVSSHSR